MQYLRGTSLQQTEIEIIERGKPLRATLQSLQEQELPDKDGQH
jgi:hypothetical protein